MSNYLRYIYCTIVQYEIIIANTKLADGSILVEVPQADPECATRS